MAATIGVLVAASGLLPAAVAASPVTVGYRDFSFSGTSAPTGEKPQSKLWYNDGIWWGNLFNSASKTYHIYRLDSATQTWSDTGTVVDNRAKAWSDAKWDGNHLYVASAVYSTSASSSVKVWRFSYHSNSKSYSLDSGFPVTVSSGGVEAVVLETDTTGVAWVTFTQNNKVWVTHSVGAAQTNWIAPYVIPLPGADNLISDDISSIVAFDGKIGVMWSNQNPAEWAMYWATHVDGAGDTAADWVANTAVKAPEYADDHLNLKQLTADATGRVYAVTKTSLNKGGAPLQLLLVLKPNGTWQRSTVWTVADDQTRAILLIDTDNRMLYVFAASPCCSGGIIYMKSTSIDNINFPSGKGTPFIQSSTDTTINNPSSTKQNVNGASGLIVIASDDHSRYYLHNKIDLGPADTTPPDTIIDSGPTGTIVSSNATFTFHATETPATFECRMDGGSWGVCVSPKAYSNLTDGPHTFSVRATDATGNTDQSPDQRAFVVDSSAPDTTPPSVTLTAPSQGAFVGGGSVSLTATASDDIAVDHVDFLVNGQVVGTDATSPYATTWNASSIADGAATITAHAVDTSTNAADDSHAVTVDNTPPDTIIDSGPTGTVTTTSASFTFHASQTGSTFACRLDGGGFSSCSSPATYTNLANGSHTFDVRATDPAGNTDGSPASQTWTVNVSSSSVFSDGFESGDFSGGGWAVTQTGDGSATVQSATVKSGSFAARLSETANTGSVAAARKNLGQSYDDLTVAADFQVQQEGASGGNVPLFRLYDASNVRLLTVYRQNLTNGQIWASDGTRYQGSALLPLNAWGRLKVHVTTAGTGASTLEMWLGATKILTANNANLGSSGVRSIQIGNDTSKQTFSLVADDVLVTQGP